MQKYLITTFISLVFLVSTRAQQSVGIGVSDPDSTVMLEVNGSLKIGHTTTSNPTNGSMRWNETIGDFEGYMNNAWVPLTKNIQYNYLNGATNPVIDIKLPDLSFELDGTFTWGNSIALPMQEIMDRCGDSNGCKITITLKDWSTQNTGVGSGLDFRFYYSKDLVNGNQRIWRVNTGSSEGIDGDGNLSQIFNVHDACFLLEGAYVNNFNQGDNSLGIHFFKSISHIPGKTCSLVIED